MKKLRCLLCGWLLGSLCMLSPIRAQFVESFDEPPADGGTPAGWTSMAGDGVASMEFIQRVPGHATIRVDARQDRRNIWWALIKRPVPSLDLPQLMQPSQELRVEARIKLSHAPRRVNLHVNHQRTTDFHSHLMEFDIPDTLHWHRISMTTQDFEVQPGDQVNVQMALMDWGQETYEVMVDYLRVDVVPGDTIAQDLGRKMPYHPPIPPVERFGHHVQVAEDAVVSQAYPELNFNDWQVEGEGGGTSALAVNLDQWILLRWDFDSLKGRQASGAGLLELSTHSLQRAPAYAKDFGMVRIVEILGGDPRWKQEGVSLASWCQGAPLREVLNGQMVIDYPVPSRQGAKALFTINQAVVQRLLSGKTLGLAVLPLGAVHATFFASEAASGKYAPRLHLSLSPPEEETRQ